MNDLQTRFHDTISSLDMASVHAKPRNTKKGELEAMKDRLVERGLRLKPGQAPGRGWGSIAAGGAGFAPRRGG